MKTSTVIIIGISLLIAGLAAYAILSSDPDAPEEPPVPSDPLVLFSPAINDMLVGQSTAECVLTGMFSVPGDLRLTDDERTFGSHGVTECNWEFTPDDLVNYNIMTGTITINVFQFKLTFDENGGFELDDVYFNGTYTLANKLLTAKNEYRFNGWSLMDNILITYPYVVSNTIELHAQYSYHTPEKIKYAVIYDNGAPTEEAGASANWGNHGIPERPPGHRPFDPPVEGSISGEVIIADMYDGMFVTRVTNFGHTNITGIVFSNYVEEIGEFIQCRSLGPELIIPNTVKEIYDRAFDNCISLERVEFEDGDDFIKIGENIFYQSGLEEVVLKRVTEIPSWAFGFCDIQTITIPADVTSIGLAAFSGSDLREIIWEGDKLKSVGALAFAACPLTNISFPESTYVAPDAFRSSKYMEKINITDAQITQIAKELHESYIGPADDLVVNIERDAKYGGMNYEGEYIANTETINLKFEHFSIYALDALIHEFFHHYQYVLTYGVGSEDFNTVPVQVYRYSRYSIIFENPYIIVANKEVLFDESFPSMGYLYENAVDVCIYQGISYVLIDEDILNEWRQPYIPLLPDESNWDDYWNQPFEADARAFSSWFTDIW